MLAKPKTPKHPKAPKTPKVPPRPTAATPIKSWSTDPYDGTRPLEVSAPSLPGQKLPTNIKGRKVKEALYDLGTPEFRYWTAAEVLRRAADFWSLMGCTDWQANVRPLPVGLDEGEDLNAYYSRDDYAPRGIVKGLSFFHGTVPDSGNHGLPLTVFSGESPDVVAHELGHAILDSLKPELWDHSTAEAAAFHESFGDMSALLTALQVPSVRQAVLAETQGHLGRNSLLSRMAEQLGYAVRQRYPHDVDRDCLRNAANSWVYRDPTMLSDRGPASVLTSQAHNFSRIFTGAFLEALGGMVITLAGNATPTADHVHEVSKQMGQLLVRAVRNAPLRTRFYQAVAEQLILADDALFGGQYAQPLVAALVRHGLIMLPPPAPPLAAATGGQGMSHLARAMAFAAVGVENGTGEPVAAATQPTRLALDGTPLGLAGPLLVEGPAIDDDQEATRPLGVVSLMARGPSNRQTAAQTFVEGLALQGKIHVPDELRAQAPFLQMLGGRRITHRIEQTADGPALRRVRVDCGCCG